jgi:AraC-like DNA-binding protein
MLNMSFKYYFWPFLIGNMQLILSILGIFLSAILLWFNARENKSTIYLGISFILASIFSLQRYVINYSGSLTLVSLFLVNSGFVLYLLGPTLYLYIRSILTDNPRLKKRDLSHLLTLLLYLIVSAPYLFTSWEFKKEVAQQFILSGTDQTALMTDIMGSRLLLWSLFFIPIILVFGYIFRSSAMLFMYLRNKKERQVFIRQQHAIPWIRAFMGFMMILITIYLLVFIYAFQFEGANFYRVYRNLDLFLAAGPVALLVFTFFSPGILYGLPRVPGKKEEPGIAQNSSDPGQQAEKTSHIQLESRYLQSFGREADACMETYQPYTNPAFSLAELSVLIHIPVHHLSYYFREEKKQSFSDYRNEWRVKHAKKLILEGRTGEMTLEAIGMLSGFPNRDSFRTAFQRIEGVTPAVFISQKRD